MSVLVESWRDSWTKWSQKINAVVTMLPLAWASLPDDWRSQIPQSWIMVFAGLGLANFVATNLRQKKREEKLNARKVSKDQIQVDEAGQ